MPKMNTTQLVAFIKSHALTHYNAGWDVVVETMSDEDLAARLKGVTSQKGAIAALAGVVRGGAAAKAPAKPAKQKPAPKAEKSSPKTLGSHVYCQPATQPEDVVPVKAGSKKHALFSALWDGASLEELMAATQWTKATVQSAFGVDVKASKLGVERRDDGRYYLLVPQGLKSLPVISEGVTKAEALVAACR